MKQVFQSLKRLNLTFCRKVRLVFLSVCLINTNFFQSNRSLNLNFQLTCPSFCYLIKIYRLRVGIIKIKLKKRNTLYMD